MAKQPCHLFDIEPVLLRLCTEGNFKKREQPAAVAIGFDLQDFLENVLAGAQKELYESTIFAVVMLSIDEGVQECEHEFVQRLHAQLIVVPDLRHQLVLEVSDSDVQILRCSLPVAPDLGAYLPVLLHAGDFRLEHMPVKFHLRLDRHDCDD